MSSKNIQSVNGIQKYGPFIRKNKNVYDYSFLHVIPLICDNHKIVFFSKMTWKVQGHSWHFVHFLIQMLYIVAFVEVFYSPLFRFLQQSWSYSSMLECQDDWMKYYSCKNNYKYQVSPFASKENTKM